MEMFSFVLLAFSILIVNVSTTSTVLATTSGMDGEELFAPGILTPEETQRYEDSLMHVKDFKCRYDLNATLRGIVAGEHWAVAMYDASVKAASGIESGVLHQFGHFDECLEQSQFKGVSEVDLPVRAKYCLVDVRMNVLMGENIGTRRHLTTNYTTAHWGACVPASCQSHDIAMFLQRYLERPVMVNEKMCQLHSNELHIDNGMFVYALVILFFVVLAVASTTYHVYLICETKRTDDISKSAPRSKKLTIALLSFSIIENTKKMFQDSKDQLGLNSINGIKALAMLFILAGHAVSFIYGSPVYNVEFMREQSASPLFAFLSNSLLFVDSFLLLSGFLFCRILLIELERRRGKLNVLILYVARYIRLTPAYMAIIGFYMTWFPHIGNGPLWRERIEREQERCQASWWLNILYINNYFRTDMFCMFQSWYLSVDSQLFFLAPIAIYLLYRSRKVGLHLLLTLVAVTATIPFVITYTRKLDPTLMGYADELNDLNSNKFYVGYYIKTHMRASGYVVGLLTGYAVHLMQEKSTRIPKMLVRLAWCSASIIGTAAMFAVTRFYAKPYTDFESTLYAGFHRLGWNLSVAWLVLAVTTGHAGWLQRVLSNRAFAPISRLTYCAYLSNGIVELYHAANIRATEYKNFIILANNITGHIVNTFTVAFLLCLLFESPIHALERIMLQKYKPRDQRSPAKAGSDNQSPSTSEEQVA